MADCLIGLGSNVGNRAVQLDQAIHRICGCPQVTLCANSRYHETLPIGGPAGQDPFLNAVIRVATGLPPARMLAWVNQVERELGRERLERWGPRSIDIDVLLYDLLVMDSPDLVLPHPRMAVRRFVLEPACEVAAEMIHAPTGWPLRQLLTRLDEPPCYIAVCCADERRSTELVAAAAPRMNATPLAAVSGLGKVLRKATAGSPRVALQCALDSLAEQSNALMSIGTSGSRESLLLSDFWLNQSLALARTWPAGPEREQLQRACQAAVERAPQPRFILHLDLTAAGATAREMFPPDRGTPPRSMLDSLTWQLRRQLAVAEQGPVLCVAAADLNAATVELRAGVDAMR